MKSTTQYSVGGSIIDVADDRREEFFADYAKDYDGEPEEVVTFWVNGQPVQVKASRTEEFLADCAADGVEARRTRSFAMDDGETLRLDDRAAENFANMKRSRQAISRSLLKQAGIPERYGRSAEEREALAEAFGAYYPEQVLAPQYLDAGRNLGDAITGAARSVAENPYVSGFAEGLKRSVTDPEALYEETYGDGVTKNALLGAQDFANTVASGLMDVGAKALGGRDTAAGRAIRGAEEALPTDRAEMVDDGTAANTALNFANEFSKNTLSTLMKYSAPGVAAVDIAGSVVDNYYDAYEKAVNGGASGYKANALASAQAGIGAAEGIWLAQSAGGGVTRNAVKGALKRIFTMGGKMGVAAGARDIVEQGVEGAKNPDLARTGKAALKGAAEGAAFEATSMGVHGIAGIDGSKRSTKRSVEAFNRDKEQREARAEAKKNYDSRLSDEANADIDATVGEMVKSEVIPSWRHAEEVRRRAVEKLGTRERGESHEAVEQAVMEAAQEVQERLQSPSRVETPALERRTAEAKMRENEDRARRIETDEWAKDERAADIESAARKAEEMEADANAAKAEHDARGADIEAAFKDFTEPPKAKPDGKGKMVKEKPKADISDAQREAVKNDPQMQDIIARAKTAETGEEKSALQDEFNARWRQLFGAPQEKPKMGYAEAVKVLGGIDAALPERELRKKMAQWEAHRDDPRAAEALEAAKAVLERRAEQGAKAESREVVGEGNKAAKVDNETPKSEPEATTSEEKQAKPDAQPSKADAPDAAEASFQSWRAKNGRKDSKAARKAYAQDFDGAARSAANGETAHLEAVIAEYAENPNGKIPVAVKKTYDNLRKKKPQVVGLEITAGAVDAYVKNTLGLKGKKAEKVSGELYSRLNAALQQHQQAVEAREAEMREVRSKAAKNAARTRGKNAYAEYGVPSAIAAKGEIDVARWVTSDASNGKYKGPKDFYDYCKELVDRADAMPEEYVAAQAEAKARADRAQLDETRGSIVDADGRKWKVAERTEDFTRVVDETTGEEYIIPKDDLTVLEAHNDAAGKVQAGKGASVHTAADGKGGAGAEGAGGLRLEGGTAKEIADEQRRIAEKEEIKRRKDAPLKTGKGEIGQDLLDLGGAEGGDLFNRPQKQSPGKNSATDAGFKAWAVGRDGKPIEFDSPEQEARSREIFEREVKNGKADGKTGRILEVSDGPTEMRRLDPKLRSDPKAVAWAKRTGRTVTDGKITPDARREYDRERAMGAAKLAKRWFPDMKVTYYDHGEITERGRHVIAMRDTSGHALGWFSPETKEVALLPGADAQTVAHEIMWHGTRQWAKEQAAKGNERAKELLARMRKVEQDAPEELKTRVTRLYRRNGVTDADTLFNEWGAWDAMANGGRELEKALDTREGQRWYARAVTAAKDMVKDFMTAHGMNRVDLGKIDGMTSEELKEFLAAEFAGGRTLGNIKDGEAVKEMSTEETLWQKARRKVYDSVAPIRDAEREYEKKTGRKISQEESVDAAVSLAPGLQEAVAINQRRKIADTKDMLKKYGLSSEDLGYYMALKASAGRDAKVDAKRIAKIKEEVEAAVRGEWGGKAVANDPVGFEAEVRSRTEAALLEYESSNASHMDPREARSMLREIEGGKKSVEYGAARDKLKEVQEDTLDTLVEAGLYSRMDAERLRAEEPDYVPFKSDFDAETGEFTGHSVKNFAKKTFYEAKGRKTAAGDIVAHILNDNAIAHQKAIENKMRAKLAAFVEKNPELGTVEKLGADKVTEARHGNGGDESAIVFKRNGETMVIRLNGTRGKAIAAAITKNKQFKFHQRVQKVARGWSMTATELSPTFAIRNFTKDNIELANIVYSEMGPIKGTEFVGRYVKNQVVSSKEMMKYVVSGKVDTSNETGKLLQRFIDAGGMIGSYKNEGYGEISKALSSEQIAKELKKGKSAAKAIANHTIHSLGYLNHMSEMTSRFNAFRTKVEMGMGDSDAALWSRRALTDFNRKGDWTGATNVLRMFSNSELGASARAITALTKSKYGALAAASLMAKGAAQAIIEYYQNREEDEKNRKLGKGAMEDVSEYDRKSSMWLYRDAKTGKIVKVGSHGGPFSLLSYTGNVLARVALGVMEPKDAAKELEMSTAELASSLSGWGSVNFDSEEGGVRGAAKAFFVSAVPSVGQPLAELIANIDYAGRTVYTEKGQGDDSPYYTRARRNSPQWAVDSSEWLNNSTGGSKAREGWADIPAEAIQKIAESVGKNAAKDVITAVETGKAIMEGRFGELESRMIPVKRDFVRDAPDSTSRYYKAKREFEADYGEFKKLKMTRDERIRYVSSKPWIKSAEDVAKMISRIEELRKLESGRVKNGRSWVASGREPSKENLEKWKAQRLALQGRVLGIMKKNP